MELDTHIPHPPTADNRWILINMEVKHPWLGTPRQQ
jgi:hypothetical protein